MHNTQILAQIRSYSDTYVETYSSFRKYDNAQVLQDHVLCQQNNKKTRFTFVTVYRKKLNPIVSTIEFTGTRRGYSPKTSLHLHSIEVE